MGALAFDRAPINGIGVRRLASLGLKRPTCELELDILQFRRALTVTQQPDSIVETWIHESAHGRRNPWAVDYQREQASWLGYEEGLAEGMTRVMIQRGGLSPGAQAYVRYYRAYELLADVLQVTPEEMYLLLWSHEPGTIRRAFTDVVSELYHRSRGRELSLRERMSVLIAADDMFDSSMEHVSGRTVDRMMRRAWQGSLP
jgi:hypothetical protein